MTKNLNKFKKNYKTLSNKILKDLKFGNLITDDITHIFPTLDRCLPNEEYSFSNIIEAREFLNSKTYNKSILDICKLLVKLDKQDINEILKPEDISKFKSSLTLFAYITNPKIDGLLTLRNYDTKLIKKVFAINKEFNIFNKVLNKFFDGEVDKETTTLIESEMYVYSLKDVILIHIDKNDLSDAEDLLIKYSSISPMATFTLKKSQQKKIKKDFYNKLNKNEYDLFLKFNINEAILKEAKKLVPRTNKKTVALSFIGILLLITFSFVTYKQTFSGNNQVIEEIKEISTTVATKNVLTFEDEWTRIKEEERKAKEEAERLAREEAERKAKEEEERRRQQQSKPVVYVTPTGNGNADVVNIARAQVGNVGGEPFWRWYGFKGRVEWCAVFVSWVANQAGLGTDIIPKFALVNDGVKFYKNRQLFRKKDYTPRGGDIIFFDWNVDGWPDHVGIVEYAEGGRVYTIEGNSKDVCKQRSYPSTSAYIYGYGTPNY